MAESKVIDKFIDNLFSMKKTTLILALIFVLGFVLRLIAAINLSVAADDMHFVTHAINFFSSGRLITYDQSSGLWFAFTSIMYKLFGLTQLTSRLAALLFGSFSILVIYLLSKEFFSKKVALIAAFLFAIAPFLIKNTIAEMDVMAMFFVLLAMFLFVKALKTDKLRFFVLSGITLGLAIYTKVYPLLFIPSLLLFFVYFNKKANKKIFSSKNVKKILLFLVLIFIFTLPALTHNFLLYQEKGFLDLQFTRTTGLGKNISEQYYGWDHQFNAKSDWGGLLFGNSVNSGTKSPTLLTALGYNFFGDPINFLLGLFGIILVLFYKKEHRPYLVFFFLNILFVLPFLATIILLPKHYIFLDMLLIPLGAFSLKEISNKISRAINRPSAKIIMLVLLVFTLIFLGMPNSSNLEHFYGKSHVAQMIDFKNKNIPPASLIVADDRIYRGRVNWAFQERPYLSGNDFMSLLNRQNEISGNTVQIEVYLFECVTDDCGWGTVKNSPQLNATMEALVASFEESGAIVKSISEPLEEKSYYPLISGKNKFEIIRVHKVVLQIKDSIVIAAAQPKNWFLYDIGYTPANRQFDYYSKPDRVLGVTLDKFAHWTVILAIILAFLSPVYVLYLLYEK